MKQAIEAKVKEFDRVFQLGCIHVINQVMEDIELGLTVDDIEKKIRGEEYYESNTP